MTARIPDTAWRLDQYAEKPEGFDPTHWRIIKEAGRLVAVSNINTGEIRKLPRAWFSQ